MRIIKGDRIQSRITRYNRKTKRVIEQLCWFSVIGVFVHNVEVADVQAPDYNTFLIPKENIVQVLPF